MKKAWYLYVLECMADNSLYTGITNDLKKRLKAHSNGTGAKYTKGRGPFIIKYVWFKSSKSDAAKQECEFKKNTRDQKLRIINHLLGTVKEGKSTEHTRYHPLELIAVLNEQGWSSEGIVDDSNPENDSTYVLWNKNNETLYVGNYYIEKEGFASFPWKDPGVEQENIIAYLEGNTKIAFKY